jgi:hypothetical protein
MQCAGLYADPSERSQRIQELEWTGELRNAELTLSGATGRCWSCSKTRA